jgi:hydrogenase nickel incorporation protein HypA/HybF
MHELSIAQALVDQVTAVAKDAGSSRVSAVHVSVGALSGVDPEALRMAFPFAAEGTSVGGAALDITAVPAHLHCHACGIDATPDFPIYVCEACGSCDVRLTGGQDLLLTAVEVDAPGGDKQGDDSNV